MSKVWKGVKKVFKKVVKVIKKVVPIVLAAAAIYFTAGAALGITGATGGWTAAAGKIGAVFGEGALGATVGGAVYQAGIGAAVGGTVSHISGGSFTQGAQTGAAIGAVTGGISGYVGYTPPAAAPEAPISGAPQSGLVPQTDANAFAGTDTLGGERLGYPQGSDMLQDVPGATTPSVTPTVPTGAPAPAPTGAPAAVTPGTAEYAAAGTMGPSAGSVSSGGGGILDSFKDKAASFLGKDGWLANNQTLAGGAIQGIGMGLSANAEVEGEMAMMRERKSQIDSNYAGVNPGQNYRALAGGTEGDRYDPRSYGSWEYQYDPTQGRIIKVPAGG